MKPALSPNAPHAVAAGFGQQVTRYCLRGSRTERHQRPGNVRHASSGGNRGEWGEQRDSNP